MRILIVIAFAGMAGCGWFHAKSAPPEPTRVIVTGAAAGSIVLIDGAAQGEAVEVNDRPRQIDVAPGAHVIEIKSGDSIVYRESTYVAPGEKQVVTVLSGLNR